MQTISTQQNTPARDARPPAGPADVCPHAVTALTGPRAGETAHCTSAHGADLHRRRLAQRGVAAGEGGRR